MSHKILARLPRSATRMDILRIPSLGLPECAPVIPSRNLYILKRQNPLPFTDPDFPIRRNLEGQFKAQYMIYDEVQDTLTETIPPMDVLLIKDVPGLGKAGTVVNVKREIARLRLLPEGKATYVTPEAVEAFKRKLESDPSMQTSSQNATMIQSYLNSMVCNIFMNLHSTWTLQKWHVRAALRQNGIWAPDSAIELPEQSIEGASREMHGKCFSVFVTINGKERACVLCRILLSSPDPSDSLPGIANLEEKPENSEPLFPGAIAPENEKVVFEPFEPLQDPLPFNYRPLPAPRIVEE